MSDKSVAKVQSDLNKEKLELEKYKADNAILNKQNEALLTSLQASQVQLNKEKKVSKKAKIYKNSTEESDSDFSSSFSSEGSSLESGTECSEHSSPDKRRKKRPRKHPKKHNKVKKHKKNTKDSKKQLQKFAYLFAFICVNVVCCIYFC